MGKTTIEVPYNQDLKPLEVLLAGVKRPGDFYVQGTLEVPMPRLEVTGVGVLSFPVPEVQIAQVIQQSARAPYGRGNETILDTSVRQVWQLTPEQVRIGGKSWESSFQQILGHVVAGLGCAGWKVTAELYKMLIYDQGGFFVAHRDTEKAEGMFGTLVIALPSTHRGGELVIRHAGREAVVNLRSEEVSELTFAAFYADCEHEVQPITEGHRVCLIYNLLLAPDGKRHPVPTAPQYGPQVGAAAELLQKAFAETGAPAKLAWLLQHEYSPAGLSFAGLKGEDAALVQVLREAAEKAGCAVHLGIVHIEESGAAEPEYQSYRSTRWSRYREEDEEESTGGDFEVIEVSDSRHYVNQWRDPDDRPVQYGELPLEEGEVLPAGALEGEEPDSQRMTEATGNEGASFERSYHRAALILWPRDRFADVLMQSGVGAVLPLLRDRARECAQASSPESARLAVIRLAGRMVDAWGTTPTYRSFGDPAKQPDRSQMIGVLGEIGEPGLLERFLSEVVKRLYDGSENEALVAQIGVLGAGRAGEVLAGLAAENMRIFHQGCVDLLQRLVAAGLKPAPEWAAAFRQVGKAVVQGLPQVGQEPAASPGGQWWRARQAKPIDGVMLADLMETLASLDAPAIRRDACLAVVTNEPTFHPATVVVPALEQLGERTGNALASDPEGLTLWRHAAEFLLARSEQPPVPPKDWRQDVKFTCRCELCQELQAFALDPVERVHRFRVRKERRQHLHGQIEQLRLDMTHETERVGSPQTLVCTKDRRTFQWQCERHLADQAAMGRLLELRGLPAREPKLARRMTLARERAPATNAVRGATGPA